jgi:hypothetical protein
MGERKLDRKELDSGTPFQPSRHRSLRLGEDGLRQNAYSLRTEERYKN